MYLYTLELPKREGPKGHPTFVEEGGTYMVQVLLHMRAYVRPGWVRVGLGLLILKFFEQCFFQTFGLQSIGLGGGLGLIDFELDRELGCSSYWRLIETNCPTAAWLVYKEDPNPM